MSDFLSEGQRMLSHFEMREIAADPRCDLVRQGKMETRGRKLGGVAPSRCFTPTRRGRWSPKAALHPGKPGQVLLREG